MSEFKVIYHTQFKEYGVRNVLSSTKLIIAFCIRSGDDWVAANIMRQSSNEHDLICFVRLCKTMNSDFKQKALDRQKGLV